MNNFILIKRIFAYAIIFMLVFGTMFVIIERLDKLKANDEAIIQQNKILQKLTEDNMEILQLLKKLKIDHMKSDGDMK